MSQLDPKKVKKLMSYRKIVWGILAVAYMIVFFHRLAVGVVREELVEAFSISGKTFADLGATYFYAYMIMQIPSGFLADSLGARKTVTIGTLVAALGSIIFGLAPSISIAFVGRLLVGLGVSVVFIAILKTISVWYKDEEFGTMSGITSFVGNMGGLLAQTPLVWMVAVLTWRTSFVVIGVVSLIVAILSYTFVRNSPDEIGLPTIAEIEGKVAGNGKGQKPDLMKGLVTVIKNPKTWPGFFLFAAFFGAFVCMTGAWGTSYMQAVYGLEKSVASTYMMAAVIGLAIGSIAIGSFSDKIKKRKLPMMLFGLMFVLSWGIIVFAGGGKAPLGILYPLYFMMGFATPAFVLGWACSKEINPPEIAGISTSVVNMGGFFGAAILPRVLGGVFDKYGDTLEAVALYQKAFMYCFIAAVIGFGFTFLIQETNCRNIYNDNKNIA